MPARKASVNMKPRTSLRSLTAHTVSPSPIQPRHRGRRAGSLCLWPLHGARVVQNRDGGCARCERSNKRRLQQGHETHRRTSHRRITHVLRRRAAHPGTRRAPVAGGHRGQEQAQATVKLSTLGQLQVQCYAARGKGAPGGGAASMRAAGARARVPPAPLAEPLAARPPSVAWRATSWRGSRRPPPS